MTDIRDRFALLLAQAPPATPAIVHEGAWWNWSDVQRVAAELETALTGLGLGAAARIGLALENRPQHLSVAFAVLATGRCVTTLGPMQPAERLAADIARSELPVVIGSPDVLERAGVREAIAITGCGLALGADGTLGAGSAETPTAQANTFSPGIAVEMLTSGTTGPPKRVQLTDLQLQTSMSSAAIPARSTDGRPTMSEGVNIVATPLVHIGGLWNGLGAMYAGRRVVLLDRFRVDEWVEVVATHRPRAAGLVPAAMRAVMDADIPVEKLRSLQVVLSGTAPCPPALAEEFTARYGTAVLMTYGATEFAGAVAGWTYPLHKDWWGRKKGSAGRAFPGVTLRVVGADGAELPVGSIGRLEISTKQAAAGAGWTRTSDLARLDDDGFLWIEGRADDAIIRGGFKISPETVKRVLEQHPSVAEAAVAGVPDRRLGAVPVAAVELRAGEPEPSIDELLALCRAQLTPYEVPVDIRVVTELPRSAALKISKVDLLAIFADRIPA